MIRLFFFSCCVFLLFFTACQKDSSPNIISYESYSPYTIGSYWIYQQVLIDSNGTEQLRTTVDTVSVIGDSIINGLTYSILKGKLIPFDPYFPSGIIGYVRDSLHYLVNSKGTILFSSQDFNSTLSQFSTTSYNNGDTVTNNYSYKMENVTAPISLPAGTFNVLNYERTASSTDPLLNRIFAYRNSSQYYAKGVGKVLQSYIFSDKRYLEQRLLEYHIE